MWVDILLPLPVENTYSYEVPESLEEQVAFGKRVEVQFGKKKLYTGLIIAIHTDSLEKKLKPIREVLDSNPVINPEHLRFWKWIAWYYCCFEGDVMNAALPAPLKIDSETLFTLNKDYEEELDEKVDDLSDESFLISEALSFQNELRWEDIQNILQKNNIKKHVNDLLSENIIAVKEKAIHKKRHDREKNLVLEKPFQKDLQPAFDKVTRSPKQTRALLAYQALKKEGISPIQRKNVIQKSDTDTGTIRALIKKEILVEETVEKQFGADLVFSNSVPELSDFQEKAIDAMRAQFSQSQVVLLEGVTGSGKTRVYLEWIREIHKEGKQTLLMIPEIALTTQIIFRLEQMFDSDVIVYHSKISEKTRMEAYYHVQQGAPLVIGTRSSLLLPFQNLGLIIVDEEHDRSYKQSNPAPRYQARDAAIYLAYQVEAKVVLGTATPSIESWDNVLNKKYGYVQMTQRFGNLELPSLQIVDLKKMVMNARQKEINISPVLEQAIHDTLDEGRQVMIFQNRRGFAPVMNCNNCGYIEKCESCDVSMTYHKFSNKLQCHYCRKEKALPPKCPNCGHWGMEIYGLGTEKIEEHLKDFFPDIEIDRLDYDTAAGKRRLEKILQRFTTMETQILVGTQMISKGLDFDNVGLVAIPAADQLLGFPNFRSNEWAFQMLKQVSGRAGRKGKQGKVLIQTYDPKHDVYKSLISGDDITFYKKELVERKAFFYPPFTRMVKVTFRNKDKKKNYTVANELYRFLEPDFKERISLPVPPLVSYVRNYHLLDVFIKLQKGSDEGKLFRKRIQFFLKEVKGRPGYSNFRIIVDADPV